MARKPRAKWAFWAMLVTLAVVGAGLGNAQSFRLNVTAGTNYVDLGWQDGATADSYEVYRGIVSSLTVEPDTLLATVAGDKSAYRDTAVDSETTYYYLVRAVALGQYRESGEISVTLPAVQPHGDYSTNPAGCFTCHRGHTADGAGLLFGSGVTGTCYSCHGAGSAGDAESGFNLGGSVHPLNQIDCAACHDAHLDPCNDPRLLEVTLGGVVYHRGGGSGYCLACHDELAIGFNAGGSHNGSLVTPAGTEIGCRGCHEPHGSDLEWLLRSSPYNSSQGAADEANGFCLSCHEYGGGGRDNAWEGEESYNRGHGGSILLCSECHEPHGAVFPDYLIRSYDEDYGSGRTRSFDSDDYGTCFECHLSASVNGAGNFADADQGLNLHNSHLVDVRSTCKECHRPHGEIPGENPALQHLVGFPVASVTANVYGEGPMFQEQAEGGYCLLNCHGKEHDQAGSVYSYVYHVPARLDEPFKETPMVQAPSAEE